jgi:hypothetical protein
MLTHKCKGMALAVGISLATGGDKGPQPISSQVSYLFSKFKKPYQSSVLG